MPERKHIEVDWYGEDVMVRLKKFEGGLVKKGALQCEAQVKANIAEPFEHKDGAFRGQIDTSAMLNATIAVLDPSSLPHGALAAVQSTQEYAVYQEAIRPFFFPAIEEVAGGFDGEVRTVARETGVA